MFSLEAFSLEMFLPERPFSEWKICGFYNTPATLFKTIESTHSLMKKEAIAGAIPAGTLYVADSQSAGHGRHERTWFSPEGKNLYFNILIPLDGISLSITPQITQIAALTFADIFRSLEPASENILQKCKGESCAEKESTKQDDTEQKRANKTCEKITEHITVKWPNDILFGKSKFCGILAEIIPMPKPALSMGVGINVNSEPKDYTSLGRAVTTLKAIAGRNINREKLLQALIGNLERALGQFKAFGISPWVESWRRMDRFIGARGTIIVNNHCTDQNRDDGTGVQKKSGTILDMQKDGSLLFRTDNGDTVTVYSADLEI